MIVYANVKILRRLKKRMKNEVKIKESGNIRRCGVIDRMLFNIKNLTSEF